jgi:hypothetical protein
MSDHELWQASSLTVILERATSPSIVSLAAKPSLSSWTLPRSMAALLSLFLLGILALSQEASASPGSSLRYLGS